MSDVAFRALVLSALWIIMRSVRPSYPDACDWRAKAIGYMDEHGQQTDEASFHPRGLDVDG